MPCNTKAKLAINEGDYSMFPIELDGAIVLYYTLQDNYGYIIFPNGEIADYYRYLAICQYPKDDRYYLFCCDENYEVVNDTLHDSIEECMAIASQYKDKIVWNKA